MDNMIVRTFAQDIEHLTSVTTKLTKTLKKQRFTNSLLCILGIVGGVEIYLLNKELSEQRELIESMKREDTSSLD